ncbi:hypothetical protein VTL71DRAFT_60 [Oculimacula yallundae]|uniref:Major facilitator superfamily (MFS) profile domain-containing protein n=1 Tax=Oculimacula yallundae TaxID=86028 RepID=A0ABR4CZ35_9HELO
MLHEKLNMAPISVGLMGYGFSTKSFHLPFIVNNKDLKISAFLQRAAAPSSSDVPPGKHCTIDYPEAKHYRTAEEFFADPDIELVIVCTHHDTHAEFAEMALRAGKHVVVEKPFTVSTAEADRVIAASKSSGKILTVFQNRRYDSDFLTLQDLILKSSFGALTEVEIHYDFDFPTWISGWTSPTYRPGQGMMFGLGSHTIDQALTLFGLPSSVTAFHRSLRGVESEVDDSFTIIMQYTDEQKNLLVTIKTSVVATMQKPLKFLVRGYDGSFVKFGDDRQESQIAAGLTTTSPGFGVEDEKTWGLLTTKKQVHDEQNFDEACGKWVGNIPGLKGDYEGFYRDLVGAIRGEKELVVKPQQSRDGLRVIELARESAEKGCTVSWFGRGKSLRTAISACCLLAFTLFGYDQGVFGGILQNQNWLDQFGHPGDTKTGIIVASYNLGCLLGCFISFLIGNPLGRRKVMWTAATTIIIGAVLQTTAYSIPHLVIARIVTGVGTGLETSTVPMYQSELCEARLRGRLVSAEVLFVGVGISLAYWLDFGMSFTAGSVAWRFPIAFQIVFAIFVIILVFGLPESPRWLYNHDRAEEAVEVLCMVYDKESTDPLILHETSQIIDAINLEDKNGKFKWRNILKRDSVQTGRRVLLAWGIQFMNQAGGINLVVYYILSVLVQNVGLSPRLSQILGGCINMMFMFGSLLPSFCLDRMGRRKTMFWGCAGLGVSMMMISILLSFKGSSVETQTASAAVAFFFTYMLIFGASVNCVPWVYVPEILPLEARAKGTAIGISSNWLWNFTIVMITPVLINRLLWKAYLIFMATNLAFIPIFYFFYPETSNKTLEEIDYLFVGGTSGLPYSPYKASLGDDSEKAEKDEQVEDISAKDDLVTSV